MQERTLFIGGPKHGEFVDVDFKSREHLSLYPEYDEATFRVTIDYGDYDKQFLYHNDCDARDCGKLFVECVFNKVFGDTKVALTDKEKETHAALC